ncbi:hypothetical protein H8L32_11880 [Undibacterium sp. CY18W]|uniref:Uncharacterized protein n=1 Tax=Undibacterium hunanense TaxID=2762292 RepID=A0ABR6ZRE8_9BURK|nr:hypothetical protein [Undibacterium hunanense]MBC3918179.1 hypothetical protein [Undibacterium hunanense]
MSEQTILHIQFIGENDIPDISSKSDEIIKILTEDGIHKDVLCDLIAAFSNYEATFNVHSIYLLSLIESIASLFPSAWFGARGLGEEFRYTWVAEFQEGRKVFIQGPWDYE